MLEEDQPCTNYFQSPLFIALGPITAGACKSEALDEVATATTAKLINGATVQRNNTVVNEDSDERLRIAATLHHLNISTSTERHRPGR